MKLGHLYETFDENDFDDLDDEGAEEVRDEWRRTTGSTERDYEPTKEGRHGESFVLTGMRMSSDHTNNHHVLTIVKKNGAIEFHIEPNPFQNLFGNQPLLTSNSRPLTVKTTKRPKGYAQTSLSRFRQCAAYMVKHVAPYATENRDPKKTSRFEIMCVADVQNITGLDGSIYKSDLRLRFEDEIHGMGLWEDNSNRMGIDFEFSVVPAGHKETSTGYDWIGFRLYHEMFDDFADFMNIPRPNKPARAKVKTPSKTTDTAQVSQTIISAENYLAQFRKGK